MPTAPIRGRTRHASRSTAKMELVTTCEKTGAERLVKSTDRVRSLGDMDKPTATVESVLDLQSPRATPKPVTSSVGGQSSKQDS